MRVCKHGCDVLDSRIQWNPDFSNLQGKRKLVREIGEFEKSEVKLQYLTEEREPWMLVILSPTIRRAL